jgi:hypothetical protein
MRPSKGMTTITETPLRLRYDPNNKREDEKEEKDD